MSINTAMTAIADKIRGLLGLSGTMGLDAMASNLAVEQTNIADAYAAVSSKGGTMPESQVSGNLAAAIGTISTSGLDTSDATATANDIEKGKTAYVNGGKITGTLATLGSTVGSLSTANGNIRLTYDGNNKYILKKGTILYHKNADFGDAAASDVAAGKTFTSAAGLKVTGTHECTGGIDTSDATAVAADILAGKTAYVNGQKITGSIASRSAQTITPGTSDQTIASGQYLSGKQTIKGDANLLPGNIKNGVSVFGVDGTYVGTVDIDTSDATATADDMAKGKTAYVNGQKITGTLYEYTENTTEILGHQNTEVSQKTVDGVPYLYVRGQTTGKGVMRIGSWAKARTPLSTLGDASASDVAAGKTFTSAAGLKVTGTHECTGGIDTSDATATANDMAKGVTAYAKGKKITGSLAIYTSKPFDSQYDPCVTSLINDRPISIGIECKITERSLIEKDGRIIVSTSASKFGDATAEDVASGKTFTSAAGVKVTGTHKCAGIDTSDATATAEDIVSPATAYVNGEKVTGSLKAAEIDTTVGTLYVSVDSDSNLSFQLPNLSGYGGKRMVVDVGQKITLRHPISNFGDAAAEDVAAGKTFTSAAGLKVTGTKEDSSVETFHITSTSDKITPKGSGTVKVWGYGYKSGSYMGTTYAFVGDGYYSGGYGTPSKTSATFGINADGTVSGLPSGLTNLDVLVTIGI